MARPTYSTKLDTILAGSDHRCEWRLLTVALSWPDDGDPDNDPPFAAGDYVSAPVLGTPAVYAAATFDPAVWTDISALVVGHPQYQESAGQACAVLSFTVPDEWDGVSLKAVLAENRVFRLQERWRGSSQDTDWFDIAYCFSDGFNEQWDGEAHTYQVTARDAMKFALLHLMGRASGFEVYQPDLIQVGSVASHYTLTLINTAQDAYEYAVVDAGGNPHPNWAPRPAAQLWCHDPTSPVRLSVAGEAVQVVCGDGIVRVMQAYAAASPGSAGEEDYSLGLGVVGAPDIRGVVWRYAHPVQECYNPAGTSPAPTAATDLIDSLEVTASGAGYVRCAGDYSALPDGLTLIALDGTGERVPTSAIALQAPGVTEITLRDATRTITVGTTWRYGDSNRLTEVARRMMLQAGYQGDDSAGPLYLEAITDPVVSGTARQTILAPKTYRDVDQITPGEALEDLRREGWVPPNWVARGTPDGQVRIESVQQLAAAHADIIPVTIPFPPAVIHRLDHAAYTDVIARGLVRQVQDAGRQTAVGGLPAATVVAEVDGGLTATPALALENSSSPSADQLAYLLAGGESYGTDTMRRRLFGWDRKATSIVRADELEVLAAQWMGAALLQVELPAAVEIDAIELDLSNSWAIPFLTGRDEQCGDTWASYTVPIGMITSAYTVRQPAWEPGAWAVYYWDTAAGWLPLISYIAGRYEFPDVQRIESKDFDTGAPVSTSKLRIYCVEPSTVENGYRNRPVDTHGYDVILGFYCSSIRIWQSSEVRGVAALGQTAPFNSADWVAVRKRLRERTYVVAEAAPWAQTQTLADGLALEWLKEFARDLAPRALVVRRPEVHVWDTISCTLPDGVAHEYLVTGTARSAPGEVSLTVVDYTNPYG